MRMQRLRYLPPLALRAPTVLLRRLCADKLEPDGWRSRAVTGFDWLYEQLDEKQRLTAAVHIQDFAQCIKGKPTSFRAMVIMRRLQDKAQLQQWHEQLREYQKSAEMLPLPALAQPAPEATYMCCTCGATFACRTANYVYAGGDRPPDHRPTT